MEMVVQWKIEGRGVSIHKRILTLEGGTNHSILD